MNQLAENTGRLYIRRRLAILRRHKGSTSDQHWDRLCAGFRLTLQRRLPSEQPDLSFVTKLIREERTR